MGLINGSLYAAYVSPDSLLIVFEYALQVRWKRLKEETKRLGHAMGIGHILLVIADLQLLG